MRPELFHIPVPGIGTIPIYTYGFMVMVGLLAAVYVASRRARLEGIDPAVLTDLALYTMVGAIVGARLFYVIQFRDDFDWRLFKLDAATFSAAPGIFGLVLGALLGTWLARRKLGDLGRTGWFTLLLPVLLGIVGARLAYGLANPGEVDFGVFRIDRGGLVFYGGFFAAFLTGLAYVKAKRLPVGRFADLVAPPLALGQAFGRIGCFLNGCCFGEVCSPALAWGVEYPKAYMGAREIANPVYDFHLGHLGLEPTATHSLPVHPTQIYESLLDFALFVVLLWYLARRRRDGDVMLLYVILYSALRFVIEFLRGDNSTTFTGLTIGQDLSLALFALSTAWFVARRAVGLRPAFAEPTASESR